MDKIKELIEQAKTKHPSQKNFTNTTYLFSEPKLMELQIKTVVAFQDWLKTPDADRLIGELEDPTTEQLVKVWITDQLTKKE